MSNETTNVRLVDGAVVTARVIKRTAKRVQVCVPYIIYGVVGWHVLHIQNDRADVPGEPCNAETFKRATAPAAGRLEAARWLA